VSIESRRVPAGAAVLRGHITAAIRSAAIAELASVGYGRLSIEAIARRAGVAKTAVYRRWSSKLDMVLELVSEVAVQRLPLPDSGSLSGDLLTLLQAVARGLQHRLAAQIIPDLLAEAARTPAVAQTLKSAIRGGLRDVVTVVTDRGVQRGELAAAPDPLVAVDVAVGPIYWRLAVAREPLTSAELPIMAAAAAAALMVVSQRDGG
jgi:AcrR family transcriptional regulator